MERNCSERISKSVNSIKPKMFLGGEAGSAPFLGEVSQTPFLTLIEVDRLKKPI